MMLKSKSFNLEKPKKGEGWAKFQEWNRRWNKILTIIFGVLSFTLLFAIVIANIWHTNFRNYDIITTTTTTTEAPPEPPTIETTTYAMTTTTDSETSTDWDSTTTEFTTEWDTSTTTEDFSTTDSTFSTDLSTNTDLSFTSTETLTTIELPIVTDTTTTDLSTSTESPTSNRKPVFGMAAQDSSGQMCQSPQCILECCSVIVASCTFICVRCNGNFSTVSQIVETLAKKSNCETIHDLWLTDSRYRPGSLNPDWLPINRPIIKLFIETKVQQIKSKAFQANWSKSLDTLSISEASIAKIDRSTFIGLENLKSLTIFDDQIKEISKDSFEVLTRLKDLNIEKGLFSVSLQNVTGSTIYSQIESVSLRYNVLGELNAADFVGIPNVKSLFLSESQISSINVKTFWPIAKSVENLHLAKNKLTYLNAEVFSRMLTDGHPHLKIYLEGNLWNCDCALLDFQEMLRNQAYKKKIIGDILCSSPVEMMGEKVVDVDLCGFAYSSTSDQPTPHVSTTVSSSSISPIQSSTDTTPAPPFQTSTKTTTTTRSTTRSTTTTHSPVTSRPTHEVIEFSCPATSPYSKGSNIAILFDATQRFHLEEQDKGQVHVTLRTPLDNLAMIWFENTVMTTIPPRVQCRTQLSEFLVVPNLESDTIYTFCLMPQNETVFSPFNCLSLPTKAKAGDRIWLKYDDKIKLYLIITLIAALALVVGIVITFLYIRRHPNVVKKEKGIVVRKKSVPDGIPMSQLPYTRSTMTRPASSTRPLFQRSVSDTSLASVRSYVSAMTPSPLEIIAWEMDRNKVMAQDRYFYNLERLPDRPPPIPPHPKRRSEASFYSNDIPFYQMRRRPSEFKPEPGPPYFYSYA